jgi:hypothetical protein
MTRTRYSQKLTVAALAILAASCSSNNAQNSGSGGSSQSAGGMATLRSDGFTALS